MTYFGRPSISPVIAGLFSAGLIKRGHAILDAGCGTGTDCLTLASWGVRRVVGLDERSDDLERAHKRLLRLSRERGEFADRVEWHFGSVTEEHVCFDDGSFDVVLDSLLFNNLTPRASAAYLKQSARIMKPGGLLVIQYRSDDPKYGTVPRHRAMPATFERYFEAGEIVTTDLVEYGSASGGAKRVRVTVVTARRRRRFRRAS
jgi:ubiquinone/menaquinone biosynthesis C-methylase UbiE